MTVLMCYSLRINKWVGQRNGERNVRVGIPLKKSMQVEMRRKGAGGGDHHTGEELIHG